MIIAKYHMIIQLFKQEQYIPTIEKFNALAILFSDDMKNINLMFHLDSIMVDKYDKFEPINKYVNYDTFQKDKNWHILGRMLGV
jgi:hypothetical protein